MPIHILATSDLHLGRKSSEVPLSAGEASTRHTWEKMIDWSLRHQIDAVLLAGDIVDRDNRYFEAIGPLQSGLKRLDDAGIAVMIVGGNHDFDVLPSIVKGSTFRKVHFMGENGTWEIKRLELGGQTVQFTGWSFPGQFVKESPLMHFNAGDLDPNLTTIGLFHGDALSRESPYGPFDTGSLINLHTDAWIVGHIHKPSELRKTGPAIWYPGSPHALSSRETGRHGPLLLTVQNPHEITLKQVPLSPVRYETITINISGAKDESAVRDRVTSELSEQALNMTS